MQFDPQFIFEFVLAMINLVGSWILRMIWTSMRDLKRKDEQMMKKVQEIEVLVAGQYVRRDELARMMDAIFVKLDHIADKLDGKADKE